MKRFILAASGMFITLITANVFAATSATLTVLAETIPPACTAILGQGGIVDFGKINTSQLSGSQVVTLTPKSIPMTISCDSMAKLNITFDDNRRDSSDDVASHYGLGKDADGAKIGYYTMSVSSPVADSLNVGILSSSDTVNWVTVNSDAFIENNNGGAEHHYSLGNNGIPTGASAFSFSIDVTPSISPEMKSVSEATSLDGSTTINIDYL